VVIKPAHDGLDDVVQDIECDRGRHLDLTPDQRMSVPQFDANGGDLVEAIECGVLPDDRQSGRLRVPVPGQQLLEPVDVVIIDPREHIGEPSLRVGDQGVHHRGTLAAAIGAGEQP
jgi:hypothetical protein